MKLHKLIKGNSKAVCLWSDISPYPAVLEIVTHLENGVILNNKKEQNYKINNKIYDKLDVCYNNGRWEMWVYVCYEST